eukprot:GEMP01015151.1.p1 GENE.GEMP01015151.1~~GEMP01015151.1.p1  ORF type:complete len:532 (+),score=108.61 GEMP01015151.1:34-1629(+)
MDELRLQLDAYRQDLDSIRNIPEEDRTRTSWEFLNDICLSLNELRGKLEERQKRHMKQCRDSWETQKWQILEAQQKEIELFLKSRYKDTSEKMRGELQEKSKELNDRIYALNDKNKATHQMRLFRLVDEFMMSWRLIDRKTPTKHLESVSVNLKKALSSVMTDRVHAEFETWELEQNNIVASVHRIDEAMIAQEEAIRKKFQNWLERDISTRFVDKQARVDILEEKLRTTERHFYRSLEIRAEEKNTQEVAMRKKYEDLLEQHDKQRKDQRTEAVRKSARELDEKLKMVMTDLQDKKQVYDEGLKQTQLILEKLNSSNTLKVPEYLLKTNGELDESPEAEEAARNVFRSVKGFDREHGIHKEWDQWSHAEWANRMNDLTDKKLDAMKFEAKEEDLPKPDELISDKLSHISFCEMFKNFNKFRSKAIADMHKLIEKREEELEAFYLPLIAKLSLRAAETSRALHYEHRLQKEAPRISPQTYGQMLECIVNTWDFLNIPEYERSGFIQRSIGAPTIKPSRSRDPVEADQQSLR